MPGRLDRKHSSVQILICKSGLIKSGSDTFTRVLFSLGSSMDKEFTDVEQFRETTREGDGKQTSNHLRRLNTAIK